MRTALESIPDIELVGEAASGERIIALVDELLPELVLVDIRMPGLDGLTCLRLIKERHPDIKVVMLSAAEHPADVSAALAGGASGYLSKRVRPSDFAASLRQVVGVPAPPALVSVPSRRAVMAPAAARGSIPPPVPGEPAANREVPALTVRERTLLDALVRGLSTKAISSELWISEKTVKFHLTNIYRKLGVHNRTSAMRYAYEHSLVAPTIEGPRAGIIP